MAASLGSVHTKLAVVVKTLIEVGPRCKALQRCQLNGLLQSSSHATPCLVQVASMSRYEPKYLEPTTSKEELDRGLEEDDLRKHRPIKALYTDFSVSPLFYDPDVQKFTNMVMRGGNKERVQKIIWKLFENLKHTQIEQYNKATTEKEKNEIECDPLVIFKQAVENCKPLLMITKVVRGGIAYRVPVSASPEQQSFRAMKWIIESCRDRERKMYMEDKLALEIMDAYNNQGKAVRKKQEVHRICESNRAYAHLR